MDFQNRAAGWPVDSELEGIALEAPENLNDSTAGLTCPHCGELEVAVQEVTDAEVEPSVGDGLDHAAEEPEILRVAVCQLCGAEFSAPAVSAAGLVVAEVLNRRRLHELRLHEHLRV